MRRAKGAETFGRVGLRMKMGLQVAFDDAVGLNVRNVTQERQAQIGFDVVLALDRIIQVIHEEGQADRNAQAANSPEENQLAHVRFNGPDGTLAISMTTMLSMLVAARQIGLFDPG